MDSFVLFLALFGEVSGVPFASDPTTTLSQAATTTAFAIPQTNVTSHGPFTGTAETTGALATSVLAASVPALPPSPDATTYPADGHLHGVEPAPYTPHGGHGTNGTAPIYAPMSDFDYQSLALALYQEWIELDLFHYALAKFSKEDFEAVGLTAADQYLLEFMADQEVGHATLITNILGAEAPVQCTYNYPFTNLQEYIDFSQKLTRWGESGVYGFLTHLDSRPSAQLLLQSITTEARQQMIFRQFEGLFPMPVWFEVGIPQSWAWTLLAPYISSCPANQTRLIWQNFPSLSILNQPNPARIDGSVAYNETLGGYANSLSTSGLKKPQTCLNVTDPGLNCNPAISHNRTHPLSYAGRQVFLQWDSPGQLIGPNNSYVTNTTAGAPKFALWVNQLNATYTPLYNISDNAGASDSQVTTAYTFQPNGTTFEGDPMVNGTVFLAVTDSDLYVTPFNLTMVNPHVNALGLYQAG